MYFSLSRVACFSLLGLLLLFGLFILIRLHKMKMQRNSNNGNGNGAPIATPTFKLKRKIVYWTCVRSREIRRIFTNRTIIKLDKSQMWWMWLNFKALISVQNVHVDWLDYRNCHFESVRFHIYSDFDYLYILNEWWAAIWKTYFVHFKSVNCQFVTS